MAGIYIHIPFCRKRCSYCDFFTQTNAEYIPQILRNICTELKIRRNYLQNSVINTIYFGGGTPSILKFEDFRHLFDTINELYTVAPDAEITFEANPDDLSVSYLESLQTLAFNRVSIGIQSFDDATLQRINRRHSAQDAILAVQRVKDAGITNVSVDLIYGLPGQTAADWEKQLDQVLELDVQHISAYGLTYEEGTLLWKQRQMGKLQVVDEDIMNGMYLQLRNRLLKNGYEAYEISNFAKKGYRSRHNSAYWQQQSYLGVGPSAHSYNLVSRQWNVASVGEYNALIESNACFFEVEQLTVDEKYNDYVMVALRTSDGVDVRYIEMNFGVEYVCYFTQQINEYIKTGRVHVSGTIYQLTLDGVMISNVILTDLMKV